MNLTEDNYFSRDAEIRYMSNSQFKNFLRCQASALAELNGEYQRERSAAMLLGSYVDEALTGDLERFKVENPELFKRDGTLKSDYVLADTMIERCRRDKLFMEYLDGEYQKIMVGEISGVPFKIKIDCLHPDKIVDLKTTKSFGSVYDADECGRVPWFMEYNYALQAAVYQTIVEQNTGRRLPFYLAAVTKEKSPDIAVIEIVQEDMDAQMKKVQELAPMFQAIKMGIVEPERCELCDYCKATKVLSEPMKSNDMWF